MAPLLPRIFALMALSAAPALAGGLPEHPPSPPERPMTLDDSSPDAQAPVETPTISAQTLPAQQQASLGEASPYGAAPPDPAQPTPTLAQRPPQTPTPPAPEELAPDGFGIAESAGLADLTRKYAQRHGVPLALLHRIIMRESRYHPRLVNHTYYGLMQITPATARGMGFKGAPKGLLDPETNLAYATPYLANAWALAGGDMAKAVRLYASGYYNTAKSKGMLAEMRSAKSAPVKAETPPGAQPTLAAPPPPQQSFFDSLFSSEPPR